MGSITLGIQSYSQLMILMIGCPITSETHSNLHSLKPTWPLRMMVSNIGISFSMESSFRGYVSFREGRFHYHSQKVIGSLGLYHPTQPQSELVTQTCLPPGQRPGKELKSQGESSQQKAKGKRCCGRNSVTFP